MRPAITAKDFVVNNLPNVIHAPTSRKYESGGYVRPVAAESFSGKDETPRERPIINIVDPKLVTRTLSSREGQDAQLNFISDRAIEIKRRLGI